MSNFLDISGLSYFWSKIKTLIAGKADATNSVYKVMGTQEKNTAAWTGNLDLDALYDGLTIAYYLPRTSAANVTLELTLKDGTTTGPIPIFYASTRLGTHYGPGSTITLTYWSAGSILINGTPTAEDRWTTSEYTVSNNLGYILRSNNFSRPVKAATYRYRLLFSSADGYEWVPANDSNSTNATAKRKPCQIPIDPFGIISYYDTTTAIAVGNKISYAHTITQGALNLGYSFNNTGKALVLTFPAPVYVKCAPQPDGSAVIDKDEPYVQSLPAEADGFIYIFLGISYSAAQIELLQNKPVYYVDASGARRLWTGAIDTGGGGDSGGSGTIEGELPKNAVLITDENGLVKPSTTTPTELFRIHGITSNVQTQLDAKAAKNHISETGEYGVADVENYGHVKLVNNLTASEYADGEALSAYQGKVLDDKIKDKANQSHASTETTFGLGNKSAYGHVKLVDGLDTEKYAAGEALSAYQGKVLKDRIDTGLLNVNKISYYTDTTWSWGGHFTGPASWINVQRSGNLVNVTIAAFCSQRVDAKISRNIIQNLPPASTRVYFAPARLKWDSNLVVTGQDGYIMCAIRPDENPTVLKVDANINPTAIEVGDALFGSFTYLAAPN